MVLIRLVSVLAAASMLLGAAAQEDNTPTTTVVTKSITTPTTTVKASAMSTVGCFATSTPFASYGEYIQQSIGNCQLVCLQEKKDVFAVSDGRACWCGDKVPPKSAQVDNSTCDTPCGGYPAQNCGGRNRLLVLTTGQSPNKPEQLPDPVSSSSAKPSSAAPTTAAAPQKTSAVPTPPPQPDSKPNTAGIAAGVVVGIVGLAAIIGGVWFFLRRRRQKQAEDDYRRNAANVDQFTSGGKLHTSNSSMNDSRIDPSFGDRRQSNGSIADNEDYSRRILKVTNV